MSEYIDEFIRRSARINRAASGEAIRETGRMLKIHKSIKAILLKMGTEGFTVSSKNIAQRKIADLIEKEYGMISKRAGEVAEAMVEKEQAWQISKVGEHVNQPLNRIPTEEAIFLSKDAEYSGKTFSKWFKEAGIIQNRKVRGIIDDGFVRGLSIDEVIKEVELTSGKANANIKTLVRTNMISTAQRARERSIDLNRDLFEGKIWNSTLDVRTTPLICGVRDQAKYDLDNNPIGHSNPWDGGPGMIHFNCRSISVPIIKGIKTDIPRPSVSAGSDYDRGDKTTNRGTVRKPTKANRDDGIFEIKQVSANTKYEDWLKRQPKDFIADALGSSEKASALKSGTPLAKLASDPLGTPINFNDL